MRTLDSEEDIKESIRNLSIINEYNEGEDLEISLDDKEDAVSEKELDNGSQATDGIKGINILFVFSLFVTF